MSTPEENLELARDKSSDAAKRETAINELRTANECDSLAKLVRSDDLDEQYRELALDGMAHPQCRSMLGTIVESGELPGSLQELAETLLDETPEDSGAGP